MQTFHNRLFSAVPAYENQYWHDLVYLTKLTLEQVEVLKGAPSWGQWPSLTAE